MPSILARWKDKVYEHLVDWHLRLEQAKPRSVYTALSARPEGHQADPQPVGV